LPRKGVFYKSSTLLEDLKIISLSHHQLPLDVLGYFLIDDEHREEILQEVKEKYNIKELFYLATCNRVELVFVQQGYLCRGMSSTILTKICREEMQDEWLESMELYEGESALKHLLRVSTSLESALVGEQEIISQLRKSFEWSFEKDLCGDSIRLVMKKAIEIAKRCFSETEVASKPISTAFLAWQRLQEQCPDSESRIVLIGAGQINRSICEFVRKSHYTDIVVANRSLPAAEELAERVNGKAILLEDLNNIDGFDSIISCTGAVTSVVNASTYIQMLNGEQDEKLIIDLAIPSDIDEKVIELYDVNYVSLSELQKVSEENKQHRQNEVVKCDAIIAEGMTEFSALHKQRQIELAMREIPRTIKGIRETAIDEIFAKDLEGLDEHSIEVLKKVMDYMEKKYVSIPMKLAREVILDTVSKQ